MVASQLKRLTTDAKMPHQTQLERSPVKPVHDQALAGFAVLARAEFEKDFRDGAEEDADRKLQPRIEKPAPNRSDHAGQRNTGDAGDRKCYSSCAFAKLLQHRIVFRRLEKAQRAPKDRIKQRASVHHVEIERDELAAEVQLGIVVKRAAAVGVQTLRERPA